MSINSGSIHYGLLPQAFLVDAKASTENNRETLQQSQLPMDADFVSKDVHVTMNAGVPPHIELPGTMGGPLLAVRYRRACVAGSSLRLSNTMVSGRNRRSTVTSRRECISSASATSPG